MSVKKTARLSDAPGCIGSPTLRAMRHKLCTSCQFRSVCATLAEHNRKLLGDLVGEESLIDAVSNAPGSKIDAADLLASKKTSISKAAKELRSQLRACGYERRELENMLRSQHSEKFVSRSFPWLPAAMKRISVGCDLKDLKALVCREGNLSALDGARRAKCLVSLLVYMELAEDNSGQINSLVEELI